LAWPIIRLRRHSAHSPVAPGVPPQAHLRWSPKFRTGIQEPLDADAGRVCNATLIQTLLVGDPIPVNGFPITPLLPDGPASHSAIKKDLTTKP